MGGASQTGATSSYASIFGGVAGLAGSLTQYSAMSSMGKYALAGAEANARMLDRQAAEVIRRGDKDASTYKKKINQMIGSQKVAMAAQGIEVSGDTALQILEETAVIGVTDAMTIRNNAWRESFGIKSQSIEVLAQGRFDKLSARAQANSSLLTGGLKAMDGFYQSYTPKTKENKSGLDAFTLGRTS